MKLPTAATHLLLILSLLHVSPAMADWYYDEATFRVASGALLSESFESLEATNEPTLTQIELPYFKLSSPSNSFGIPPLGVYDSPQPNGTHATDGEIFVSQWLSLEATLHFEDPVTAVALTITDALDCSQCIGPLVASTDTGASTVFGNSPLPAASERFVGYVGAPITSLTLEVGHANDAFGIDGVLFELATPPDQDGDSVPDESDFCPGTAIPEGVPAIELKNNRYALVDLDTVFETVRRGNSQGPTFDLEDTAGCSCEQIIEALDLGRGHEKFGCSASAMAAWVALVSDD